MTAATHGLVVPDLCHEHYGVPVTFYGEDGDMLVLGHHEPRKALAAMRKHARVDCGLDDDDTFGCMWETRDLLASIESTFATFKANSDGEWYGHAGKTAADPGALPVMVHRP